MSLLDKIFKGTADAVNNTAISYTECPDCESAMTYLGKGCYICPKCGREDMYGFEEDYADEDTEGDGYTYDQVFGSIPEVCRTCGGNYPDCKDSCNLFED